MDEWTTGYTRMELEGAQERYGVRFPPDLIALLLVRQPANGYNWAAEDPRIRTMLDWPFDMLRFGVEDGFWWPGWGDRPTAPDERAAVLRSALAAAPRLIPIYSHRFLPETPNEAGNPVFSMHGFDTIYYGANLDEYFAREFGGRGVIGPVRHIPFWSDLVERFDLAYAFYDAAKRQAHQGAGAGVRVARDGPS